MVDVGQVDNGDFGHRPVIPPTIIRNVPALPDEVLSRFMDAYVPDVSDAVGDLYTMCPEIRPLYKPIHRIVGQALTVKAPIGDNLTIHGALGLIRPHDVLVVDWRGYTGGCGTGAGSLVVPQMAGLAGVVVDGGWRDIEELQRLDLPVYGKAISAFSPPKRRPGEINVPVSCGGVVVCAGDLVVADWEGVVVVPRAACELVAKSLRRYAPRQGIAEWDVAMLEDTFRARQQYYQLVFERAGGIARDWGKWFQ
jgi:4-hydroxy-4-methyl-2-oxoglutarate aldolase